jgi:hypothetical protein
MSYALVVVFFSVLTGAVSDQRVIVNAPSLEACEQGRRALLALPGYDPKYLLCIPGAAPEAAPQ